MAWLSGRSGLWLSGRCGLWLRFVAVAGGKWRRLLRRLLRRRRQGTAAGDGDKVLTNWDNPEICRESGLKSGCTHGSDRLCVRSCTPRHSAFSPHKGSSSISPSPSLKLQGKNSKNQENKRTKRLRANMESHHNLEIAYDSSMGIWMRSIHIPYTDLDEIADIHI